MNRGKPHSPTQSSLRKGPEEKLRKCWWVPGAGTGLAVGRPAVLQGANTSPRGRGRSGHSKRASAGAQSWSWKSGPRFRQHGTRSREGEESMGAPTRADPTTRRSPWWCGASAPGRSQRREAVASMFAQMCLKSGVLPASGRPLLCSKGCPSTCGHCHVHAGISALGVLQPGSSGSHR